MNAIHRILKEEREINTINASRLKAAYDFRSLYLIDSAGDLFLTVDSLIRMNNLITRSQNTYVRTCNVKPAGFDRQYMEANKIEAALCRLVDDFNDQKITHRKFLSTFLNEIHPFADRDGRICKILFAEKLETVF